MVIILILDQEWVKVHQKSQPRIKMLSQFYKLENAFDLYIEYKLQNQINYDFVIRMRLDDKITGCFNIDNISDNHIVVNKIQNYNNSIKCHDTFFIGQATVVEKMTRLYSEINEIVKYLNQHNYFVPINGYEETFLFINILRYGVKIVESSNYKIESTNYPLIILKKKPE